jgi:outer membrane protein assembly factor BamB
MNENGRSESKAKAFFYHLARGMAVLSAVLVLMVSALEIANYVQLKAVDPLNSPALQGLFEKLSGNPEDKKLKDEIRALDLLARRAYFTRRWQVRTGVYILLAGALAFVASLKTMKSLRGKLPEPSTIAGTAVSGTEAAAGRIRKWLFAGGALVLAAALAFSLLSHSALRSDYDVAGAKAEESGSNGTGVRVFIEKIFTPGGLKKGLSGAAKENYVDTEEIMKNWPSFRGPGGKGVTGYPDTPISWNGRSGKGVVWKVPVPKPGYNSPVIWGDRLFLSGADAKGQEVYCFDRNTGAMLWKREVKGIPGSPPEPPRVTRDTGLAASTMATDGERAFAVFATGDVACFDFEGNGLWARNLGVPENHYGHSSSLITYRNFLLVQYDHGASASLIALDVKSGKTVWEAKRNVTISWSSPILVHTGTRPEVILNATPVVASYNPENGKELWSVECLMGEMGPSSAYSDGMVFSGTVFAALSAIDVRTKSIVWQTADDLPDAASPLAVSGYLFLPTSFGPVSCLDAKTGTVLWRHEFKEGSYASPICAGEKVYLMDKSGVMHIFKADREFVSLGDPPLGEPSWATPAVIGNRIYIRGFTHLFCIGSKDEGAKG